MQLPTLKLFGTCSECKQEVEINQQSFCNAPIKHDANAKPCRGSGNTAHNTRYVIESSVEAEEVARFLKDDTQVCLDGTYSHRNHSMCCNDGRTCQEIRQKLSNAFAIYFLECYSVQTDKVA